MSSTSFHTSSSVKNMKFTADAGKRRSSFRARVRRNAQFATVSSCARRFFKRFNFKFWRTIRYSLYRRVMNSCLSWTLTCGSVTIWRTFVIQIQFIHINNVVIVRALRGRPLPWRIIVISLYILPVSQFYFQLIQTRNRPTFSRKILYWVFSAIIFEFVQVFN